LVESGQVDLDAAASTYLPDLDLRGSDGPGVDGQGVEERGVDRRGVDLGAVTVEQLLSHRSGFDGDHFLVHGGHSLEQLREARRLFDPDEGYSYSNAGFSLAGAIIEAVS